LGTGGPLGASPSQVSHKGIQIITTGLLGSSWSRSGLRLGGTSQVSHKSVQVIAASLLGGSRCNLSGSSGNRSGLRLSRSTKISHKSIEVIPCRSLLGGGSDLGRCWSRDRLGLSRAGKISH
jgi:hypothetical protein